MKKKCETIDELQEKFDNVEDCYYHDFEFMVYALLFIAEKLDEVTKILKEHEHKYTPTHMKKKESK